MYPYCSEDWNMVILMREINIRIETMNDAFYEEPQWELIRILEEIKKYGIWERPIHDINGNQVGEIKIKK